jgi:hypothetical protein
MDEREISKEEIHIQNRAFILIYILHLLHIMSEKLVQIPSVFLSSFIRCMLTDMINDV